MCVRKAAEKDIEKIMDLLAQVDLVHHNGRPDIFKIGQKYSKNQLVELLKDSDRPILVCVDQNDQVLGYCFCMFVKHENNSILTDIKTLYIDDLCVDEKLRGKKIGKTLFESAVDLAKENDCYNVTLNVWSCNPSAIKFYESCGLIPQKIGMEMLLK